MELIHQSGEIIALKYRILDILGQGSSGTTYQAKNLQSDELVAIKVLSLKQLTDWKMLELFEREVKIISQINHPRIPHYLEYFEIDRESDRSFYIVQQLVEGKSLAAWVESGWRTDENGVQQIAIRLLNILVYLQNLKPPVIHRDIKPQNIIRRADGQIFLVDFGAVQDTYHNTVTGGSTVVGTYGYMAPEQFRGQAVSTTDLYGLGATLLFLLTHRSPSELPTDRLKINFRNRVQISAQFADWLEKMLEPDVEDRFSSAKEALAALRGKRSNSNEDKISQTFRWQAIVGLGVAGVVSVGLLYYYKYPLLSYFGITPAAVSEAAWNGDIDAVRHHLKLGGNVNAKDKDGHSLMKLSLQKKRKNVVELLITKGADVNAKGNDGDTPLHWALKNNWKDVAELLITKGADVNAKGNDGDTSLHWALKNNWKDVAELLITKGADVNAKGNDGDISLHEALRNKSKDVAELLIAKGADINSQNYSGETVLHEALKNNLKDIAELLIAKGADVNSKHYSGTTPLHEALRNKSKDVAELLIAKGADVNAKDNIKDHNGDTPLHEALRNNLKDIAELLIAKGADVNSKDHNGDTSLHWALKNNWKDVAELLIAKGADINSYNYSGTTPLHEALRNKSKDLVELLIAKGANVNSQSSSGTPLHEAVNHNRKDIAELLIAKGADVNAKDSSGATPLRLAVRMNNKDVVELLKNHGAKE